MTEIPSTEAEHGNRNRRAIAGILVFGLAAILLYFALRGIAWSTVWTLVRGARISVLAGVVATISVALLVRSLRWRLLLSAESSVLISQTFWATAVGYFGNNVLPARAGEVLRTLIISRSVGISSAFVFTTALSERVTDALALIGIAGIVLMTAPGQTGWLAGAAKPVAGIGLLGIAAIALLPAFESLWRRLLARLPLSASFRDKVETALMQVLNAMRSFHNPSRLLGFLLLTATIWCLDALVALGVAHSLGLSMNISTAFLLLAGLGLSSAIPSTPGYVGVYQFVAVSLLVPFGFLKSDAIAFILLLQAMIYCAILSWGGIGLFLFRGLLSNRRLNDVNDGREAAK